MYTFIFRFKSYKTNWLPSKKNFSRRRRTMPHWLNISMLEGRRRPEEGGGRSPKEGDGGGADIQ
jgi:hypothetical protein